MNKLLRHVLSATILFLVSLPCGAGVIWELNNFVFDDDTIATGSFEWDTGTAVDWNIETQDGSRSGETYTDETGTVIIDPVSIARIVFEEGSNHFRIGVANFALLDTPVAFLPLFSNSVGQTGLNGFIECTNCGSVRFGLAGAFLSAAGVPEPTTLLLLGLGLAGFGFTRQRRS